MLAPTEEIVDDVDAIVDTDAQDDETERPCYADQQRCHCKHRVADAAEPGHEHDDNAGQGEKRCHGGRGLARLHLVVLDHRQARQADPRMWVARANLAEDPAERGDGFTIRSRAARIVRRKAQQNQREPAAVGCQPLRRKGGHRGRQGVEFPKRQGMEDAGRGQTGLNSRRGRKRLLDPREGPLDGGQLRGGQVVEPFGLESRDVGSVEDRVVRPVVPCDGHRCVVGRGSHPVRCTSLDDDNDILLVAELIDICEPPAVVVARGAEQIGASCGELQAAGRQRHGRGSRQAGDDERGHRKSDHPKGQPLQWLCQRRTARLSSSVHRHPNPFVRTERTAWRLRRVPQARACASYATLRFFREPLAVPFARSTGFSEVFGEAGAVPPRRGSPTVPPNHISTGLAM